MGAPVPLRPIAAKKRRDRLRARARTPPPGALGFGDAVWWRRLAQPNQPGWTDTEGTPKLQALPPATEDTEPTALACDGRLVRPEPPQANQRWRRVVAGVPGGRSPETAWRGAPPNVRPQAAPRCGCSGTTPRGTAATPGGPGFVSPSSKSNRVARAGVSWSATYPAQARGSTPWHRHGVMGNGPSRNQTGCCVPLHSKHGSMPTMTVSVQSISSCQKRSLDYALGLETQGLRGFLLLIRH